MLKYLTIFKLEMFVGEVWIPPSSEFPIIAKYLKFFHTNFYPCTDENAQMKTSS